MSRHLAFFESALADETSKFELVDLVSQSLADTLDLAYQTKQAHWNVKGPHLNGMHILFDQLYTQLGCIADDLTQRALACGGQTLATIRAAGTVSQLLGYPLDTLPGMATVNALVERYGDYTSRIRQAFRMARKLGDQETAELYASVIRTTDKALWRLTASQEG